MPAPVYTTPTQRAVLEGRADGVCIKGVWKWLIDGVPVTREVNRFAKAGLLHLSYYRDGRGGAWPTDVGSAALQKVQPHISDKPGIKKMR